MKTTKTIALILIACITFAFTGTAAFAAPTDSASVLGHGFLANTLRVDVEHGYGYLSSVDEEPELSAPIPMPEYKSSRYFESSANLEDVPNMEAVSLSDVVDALDVTYKEYTKAQGICTSGPHIFIALTNEAEDSNAIVRVNTETFAVDAVSAPYHLGEITDMTFSPDQGIMISSIADERNLVTTLDADTLAMSATIMPVDNPVGLAYSPEMQALVTMDAANGTFAVKQDLFAAGEEKSTLNVSFDFESVDFDGSYVYVVYAQENAMVVYSQRGFFRGVFTVGDDNTVVKGICHLGDKFFAVAETESGVQLVGIEMRERLLQ